jgi:FkbM family methyltransferase
MSTEYFVLTKSQALVMDAEAHILPKTNIDYYKSNGLFEESLIHWSKQFCDKTKVFLDIGAHSGTYTISLANLCKEVHSFEPQRMTYYSLCGGVALSSIRNAYCHNFGLGSPEQIGTQTLKIVSNDGGGSSLHSTGNILATEQIEIKTLDSLQLRNIGFIKMDIEDNELHALKGAVETLRASNYPPILFEANWQNNDLFDYIRSLGYKVVNISGYPNMYLATV